MDEAIDVIEVIEVIEVIDVIDVIDVIEVIEVIEVTEVTEAIEVIGSEDQRLAEHGGGRDQRRDRAHQDPDRQPGQLAPVVAPRRQHGDRRPS